jgi:hypothetical protein
VKAVFTMDVPDNALQELARELSPEIPLEIDDQRIVLMSTEPPSWISFLADAPWWQQALAAYGALYVAKIVEAAAANTWKSRANAVAAAVGSGNRIRRFAGALWDLRKRIPPHTRLQLGLPQPSEFFPACVRLDPASLEALELQIAMFVHYVPRLAALIQSERLNEGTVATGIHLDLRDDGSLEVSWQPRGSPTPQRRVLTLLTLL